MRQTRQEYNPYGGLCQVQISNERQYILARYLLAPGLISTNTD